MAENLPDQPATTTAELSAYLDELHAANPDLPLMITEFGAEATRYGPDDQQGTYEFQRKYVIDHLAHPRVEAVRGRLDPLGAARLPRGPDLDGRRAARVGHAALAQQEPDRGDNDRKPVYFDAGAALPAHEAAARR